MSQPDKPAGPDLNTLRAMAAAVVQAAPPPPPLSYRPRFLPSPPPAAVVVAPPPAVVAPPPAVAAPPPMALAQPPLMVAPPPEVAPPVAAKPVTAAPARRSPVLPRRAGLMLAAGLAATVAVILVIRSKPTSAPPLASLRLPAPATATATAPVPAPVTAPAPAPVTAPAPAPVTAQAPAPEPAPAPARRPPKATRLAKAPPSPPKKTAPPTSPAPEDPKPSSGVSAGTESELDQLVQTALAGKEKRGESHAQEEAALPSLTRNDIQASMKPLRPRIKDCYKQFGQKGLAVLQVRVGDNGQVASTKVEGPFAGSPTGSCVEAAVKSVRFPQSAGMTFRYPFPVR